MIEITDLHKTYDTVKALDGLTLRIERGELFGLIGPNGAGKSTLLKSLVGLVKPEQGSIRINDKEVMADFLPAKAMIGYAPEQAALYEYLTGREFLEFIGKLRGIDEGRIAERMQTLLEAFDLEKKANDLIADYSHGMRQKISLSAALIAETEILLLDEPTNGLDPESAFRFKQILQMMCSKGTTVIFSSHALDTVEKICTRVGIIHLGKMIACDSVAGLQEMGGDHKSLEQIFVRLLQKA